MSLSIANERKFFGEKDEIAITLALSSQTTYLYKHLISHLLVSCGTAHAVSESLHQMQNFEGEIKELNDKSLPNFDFILRIIN